MFCVSFVCRSCLFIFFFKQKTAYEMRISDWSSDVCSSDLPPVDRPARLCGAGATARLSCRGGQGHRRRPAAQSGEVGDGGVTPAAIIFDFDGVIADSEVRANQSLAESLTATGMATTYDESLRDYYGHNWQIGRAHV